MAEICCGVATDGADCDMQKNQRLKWSSSSLKRLRVVGMEKEESEEITCKDNKLKEVTDNVIIKCLNYYDAPKFGACSVCGRRRDMEDTVAISPSFFRFGDDGGDFEFHFFAVYDGHGCSHVAQRCRERLHEIVKQELIKYSSNSTSIEWKSIIEKSFMQMDKEAIACNNNKGGNNLVGNCRCELQSPECDAVGSTAVVAIITPHKIIVANCGDSRAVLSRGSNVIPLSIDHKPDRPDEMKRIEGAGGRVVNWDGPRVLGVLALSRAIGDRYLKPYVSCEPEITITDRTLEDQCLILASDGLWDVVTNETACGLAKMCIRGKMPTPQPPESQHKMVIEGVPSDLVADKACLDASVLLTKLALTRNTADNVSVVVVDLSKNKVV